MTDCEAVESWRAQLLEAWAKDHRATMTVLLEDGPQYSDSADNGPEIRILSEQRESQGSF